MPSIIEVQNISKKYQISHLPPGSYLTLVETLSRKAKKCLAAFKNPYSKNKIPSKSSKEEFWALQEINFSLEQGDRVGIIGRNGAGKSTLLKILARIVDPTTGSIKIRGRVSSLLEVGTGFHPELTGRENIFLNGAILGMSKQEIKSKFDEIVAFSEAEKFLDTPVKRFSSGMHTRLGFGIAAHLDPDVLIVDEVLAVGDAKFQEKCLKKLDDLSHLGRVVLFVSHDMGSVSRLCNKGLLLESGHLKEFGSIEQCITKYMKTCSQHTLQWNGDVGDEHLRFHSISLMPEEPTRDFFYQDEPIRVEMEYFVLQPISDLVMGLSVWNHRGHCLGKAYTCDNKLTSDLFNQGGLKKVSFTIPAALLYEGEYLIQPESLIHNRKSIINDALSLKLHVYPPRDCIRHLNLSTMTGVTLGTNWELRT